MPDIFTITRSVIGPLTSVATLPDGCSGCYNISGSVYRFPGSSWETFTPMCYAFQLHEACAGMEADSAPPGCLPTTTTDWAFYSPGLHCPSGWATQIVELSYGMDIPTEYDTPKVSRVLDLLTKDETAAFCCPSHYQMHFLQLSFSKVASCRALVTTGAFVISTCLGWPSVTETTCMIPTVSPVDSRVDFTTDAGLSNAPIIQLVWRPQDWIVSSTEPPVVTSTSPSNKPPPPSPTPEKTSPTSTPTTTSNPPAPSTTSTSPTSTPSPSTSTSSSSSTSSTVTTESSESTKLTTSSSNEATKTSAAFTEKDKTTTTSSSSSDRFATLSTSSSPSSHIETTRTSTKTDDLSTSTFSEKSNTQADTLSTATTGSATTTEPKAPPVGGSDGGSLSPATTKTVTATTVTVGVLGFLGFGLWFGIFRKRRKNSFDDKHNPSNPERAVLDGPIKPELPATATSPTGAAHTGGGGGPRATVMSGAGPGTVLEQQQQEKGHPELEGRAAGGGISPIAEHPGEQDHLLYDHNPHASELTTQHGTTELQEQCRISELEEQRRRVELEEQQRQRAELMAMTTTPSPAPSYSQGPYPYPYAYPQPQSRPRASQQPYHYPDAVELESPPGWSPQSPHSPPPRPPRSPHTPGDRTRPESDISLAQGRGQGQGQGQYTQAGWQGRGQGQSPRQSPSLRGRGSPRQSSYLGSGSSPRQSPRPGAGSGGWDQGQRSGSAPSGGGQEGGAGGGGHEQGQGGGYL